eukprot:Skav221817  [mRNA]  locus=scaffold885:23458:24631:+ [translate_table: standard]
MSVVDDLPLSLPVDEGSSAASENVAPSDVSPDERANFTSHSLGDLPPMDLERAKFTSHSLGDLPPMDLERAHFSSFTSGDLPPMEELATMSLPVDWMNMKGFRKTPLQLRRSQFSHKNLVLDKSEVVSPSLSPADLFSALPDPESSRHR